MSGGKWTEEDLNNYDGFQNRGLIRELWQEAFDPENDSFKEFQELFHASEDYKEMIEFIEKEDEDVADLLKEKNPDNLENL